MPLIKLLTLSEFHQVFQFFFVCFYVLSPYSYTIFDSSSVFPCLLCFNILQNTSRLWLRAWVLSHVRLFATPWAVARQAPLSMGFSRQEYWMSCHALLQGVFLTQGSNLHHASPTLAGRFFNCITWEDHYGWGCFSNWVCLIIFYNQVKAIHLFLQECYRNDIWYFFVKHILGFISLCLILF